MRKKKDDGKVDRSDLDQVMKASLTLVRLAWQTECKKRGLPENAPLDLVSLVHQVSTVSKTIFDTDIEKMRVKDIFINRLMNPVGLTIKNDLVLLISPPEKDIIERLYKTIVFVENQIGSIEERGFGKEIMERLKREHMRVSGLFN